MQKTTYSMIHLYEISSKNANLERQIEVIADYLSLGVWGGIKCKQE